MWALRPWDASCPAQCQLVPGQSMMPTGDRTLILIFILIIVKCANGSVGCGRKRGYVLGEPYQDMRVMSINMSSMGLSCGGTWPQRASNMRGALRMVPPVSALTRKSVFWMQLFENALYSLLSTKVMACSSSRTSILRRHSAAREVLLQCVQTLWYRKRLHAGSRRKVKQTGHFVAAHKFEVPG